MKVDANMNTETKRRPYGIMFVWLSIILLATSVTSVTLTALLVYYRTTDAVSAADDRLLMAAEMAREIISPDYHDRIDNRESVSKGQFDRIVQRNDDLCRRLDLQYLWSVLKVGDSLVFTTATHSDINNPASACASFFDVHNDPGAFKPALGLAMKPVFSSFRNEWGEGRMVLIPRKDIRNRTYIFGASVQLSKFNAIINHSIQTALFVGLLVIGLAFLLALVLARHLTSPIDRLIEAADRMASGDLDAPLPSVGARELQSLSHSFARMRQELKQQMQALHGAEQKYRTLVDNSQSIIFTITPEGVITFISQRIKSLLGYETEAIVGGNFFVVINEDDVPVFTEFLRKAADTTIVQPALEYRAVHKDGSLRWHRCVIAPVFDDQQKLSLFVGNAIDITDRKQVEQSLAAEKEHLAVTLRSIGDGVITTDTNGNIIMVNKVAEILTGWNLNEAVGQPLSEVFTIMNELTRRHCESIVGRVLETGSIVELSNHTCLIARDGREIVIADSAAPIKDMDGAIIGVVLVFRDMTEKQKMQNTMQIASKLESLGILAGGIAHDFNNLLGGIYGYIDTAREETGEKKTSLYLEKALGTIDRARGLTQQLLTFAKGGAPIMDNAAIFPFVQEATLFVLSGSSVSCTFDIPKNLWPCKFDKNQIGQVIDNIVINAQQAMPDGGIIEISAQNITLGENEHITLSCGNYVKLSIKDQGIGILKESLPRIFDPFFTTKPRGHGLGLSTCYSIINRHGGCIEVESELGKGTTFHIYLPASTKSKAKTPDESAEKHTGSGVFLVVDDEEVMRETIGTMLESFGYSVIFKENGNDAVNFFSTEIKVNRTIAGMIFDLTIPGQMGGKEAIGEIRKMCPEIPVFVASGYAEDPVMAHPTDYGFTASISKPFMRTELAKMLNKYIKANF
ncbi:MAG: PAS domain S-box protein [Chitinivibrionales bacterium]|nr:PAS domain S-box protein [Chitinivibrionales bacterium]